MLLKGKYKQISILSFSTLIILALTVKFGMFNSIDKAVYIFFKEHKNNLLYNFALDFSNWFEDFSSLLIFLVMMLIFLKLHKKYQLWFSVYLQDYMLKRIGSQMH